MTKITFPARSDFYRTLKQRVDTYFSEQKLTRHGNAHMFLKTAIILTLLASSYVLLVFFSASLLMAVITAFAVAQGFVLVGFNIMHDGNHGSYSRNKAVNRFMGLTMDLIGGSSFIWKQKHNVLHHTYTNIDELDDDLQSSGLLRLSPEQPWRPWHRFQHWYAFPLYSLLTISWIVFSDFYKVFTNRIGDYEMRNVTASDRTVFFLTKLFYFGYMIALPLVFHPLLHVLITFVAIHLVMGFTLSVVFQLAHTVDENEFPTPDEIDGSMENEWAIHQVETTADFARQSKVAAWYLGGLNFQIEHHLFARICHVHYPALSKIVEQTCRDFSIDYVSHPTVGAAIIAHLKFLRRLGTGTAAAAVPA